MDKLKERWEFIVGYVALIVSLSAFKDELTLINLNLGFLTFTAAQYLFALILSFLFSLHLYLIPFLLSATRYANVKILTYVESLSYFVFVLLTTSPFFVFLAVGINYLINIFRTIPVGSKDYINSAVTALIGLIFGIISNVIANKYRKQKYSNQKQELEIQEISDFENAQKLFNDGYFSQSILEAFKVLELHLKRLIIQKDIPFRSNKIQDLISVAHKLELINNDEIEKFNQIRKMRNSAAHLEVEFTKTQAEEAIIFIKELIKRTANNKNAT
jgi:HEPN domain-containing protein